MAVNKGCSDRNILQRSGALYGIAVAIGKEARGSQARGLITAAADHHDVGGDNLVHIIVVG
jgi:hypothetical protein